MNTYDCKKLQIGQQINLTYSHIQKYKNFSSMQIINKAYQCICCIQKPKYPDPYNFQFGGFNNHSENKINFESNYVKTSKYTLFNFLPLALLFQFKRLANIYFLFVATLQSVPVISPLIPVTAWIPLTVVLTVSIIRQGYQDYQRYKSDQQMNHQLKTHIRKNGQFVEVQWSQVIVGDICRVKQDQLFPADMLLLTSSSQGGTAFIQTASLDGQKNLKPRNSHRSTIKYSNQNLLNSMHGQMKGKIPDKQLHKFSSNVIIDSEIIVYENDKQLLYRGSRLKNTKQIYGLVVYTGKNTKILMNSQSSSSKMSQLQRKVNRILIYIFVFQVILCLTACVSFGIFMQKNSVHIRNIHKNNFSAHGDSILIFFSYFILINSMIPISLIVSMQIVKMSQSYFIIKDNLMYSQYRNKSASVKSASLNQQLGQIEYVFSDKTGTLTMNKMQFKIALIGSQMYGDLGSIVKGIDIQNNQNEKNFNDEKLKQLINEGIGNHPLDNPITIKGGKQLKIQTQSELCNEFLFALSTAHQVIAQRDQKGINQYHGPSPDQITLVQAAKQMSYQFIKSDQAIIEIEIKQHRQQFQLLEIFPFTSDRKRMSVIIRSNGILKMYSKGADSIIKSRLAKDNILNLNHQLRQFSRFGLRTLLIAMRTVSEEQYSKFRRKVQQLPHVNRQAQYDQLVSQLQKNLYIIGATAVLDRLQQFVPETIRDLIRADIKVWMLTGDKMQTAQNIARSCNLFQNSFEILRLNSTQNNPMVCMNKMIEKSNQLMQKHQPKGLLIQGQILTTILQNQQGEIKLAELVKNCQAVVCCRLIPSQKAKLIQIVRTRLKKITLAIGDGANDVPMIKAAHIGIGLFGQQGMSAVQASDYAIPEFRMLWRLLFVHGRWNYIRISQMILYFFYKNMLFTIPQFTLAFFCAYSAQSMYDDWFISFYNLIFTSVPLVIRAVLEQDINYIVPKKPNQNHPRQISMTQIKKASQNKVIEKQLKYLPQGYEINPYLYQLFPKIYYIGQQNCIFNYTNYFAWILQAICQGVMITLFSIHILGTVSINSSGMSNSLWLVGLTTYSSVICIVTFKICTHTKFLSRIFMFGVVVLSLALYLAYMWLSNYYFTNNIMGTTLIAWTTPKAYLTVFFSICVVLFLDGIVVHIDFIRGGYTSKMRKIINENQEQRKTMYDMMSLKLTDYHIESPKNNFAIIETQLKR